MLDRNMQRYFNYTGINPYPVQDFAGVADQHGAHAAGAKGHRRPGVGGVVPRIGPTRRT
jgi:hypothetical protein